MSPWWEEPEAAASLPPALFDASAHDQREVLAFAAFLRHAGPYREAHEKVQLHPEWHAWATGKGPSPDPDSEVGPPYSAVQQSTLGDHYVEGPCAECMGAGELEPECGWACTPYGCPGHPHPCGACGGTGGEHGTPTAAWEEAHTQWLDELGAFPTACPTCGERGYGLTGCKDPWHVTCTHCGALDTEPCRHPNGEEGCA